MNSKTLIIYDYQILYEILSEITDFINFEVLEANQKNFEKIEFDKIEDFLIISSKNLPHLKNYLILDDLPLKLNKLIQIININFLKNNFVKKSEIEIGKYKLDLNSRKLIFNNHYINLTEKEAEVIVFIKSNNNVTIKELQSNVWKYSTNLDTHTVETHIYRLRKKMSEEFGDDEFIINTAKGYKIT